MQWIYQGVVEEAVSSFCREALPDAGDWHSSTYSIKHFDSDSCESWRVEVDIPTAGEDCWLDFIIERPDDLSLPLQIKDLHAIRGALKDEGEEVYYWDASSEKWMLWREEGHIIPFYKTPGKRGAESRFKARK